jgi:hypothetical protein
MNKQVQAPAGVVVKQNPKNKDFYEVYLKDVTVYYASVHSTKLKYQADKLPEDQRREYSITVFTTGAVADYLVDVMNINKQFFEVGVGKNKLRKIKFPLSSQVDEGKSNYDLVKGLHGAQFGAPEYSKAGKPNKIVVVDIAGKPTTVNIGNGSKCTIKFLAYKNNDGLLNMRPAIVQIRELVEYEGGGGASAGGVYDEELGINISADELAAIAEADAERKAIRAEASGEDEYGNPLAPDMPF